MSETIDYDKKLKKSERALKRAEEMLADYESLVDRTQHMLNTRIEELEEARKELKQRKEALEASETRFRQLAEATFEAILIVNDTAIADCNEAACRLYGLAREKLVGTSLLNLAQDKFRNNLNERLKSPIDSPFEQMHMGNGGHVIPVEIRIKKMLCEETMAYVVAVRDITEHKQLEDQLRLLASTDPLTGTNNRRQFLDLCHKEYFRSLRYEHDFSIIMMDIDFFKKINDQYGHDVGDLALCHFVDITNAMLRKSDVLGRLGGEEFALLLPSTPLAGATVLAERIRQKIEESPFSSAEREIRFTISVGVYEFDPVQDHSAESVISHADINMYEAKNSGRNRVVSK